MCPVGTRLHPPVADPPVLFSSSSFPATSPIVFGSNPLLTPTPPRAQGGVFAIPSALLNSPVPCTPALPGTPAPITGFVIGQAKQPCSPCCRRAPAPPLPRCRRARGSARPGRGQRAEPGGANRLPGSGRARGVRGCGSRPRTASTSVCVNLVCADPTPCMHPPQTLLSP